MIFGIKEKSIILTHTIVVLLAVADLPTLDFFFEYHLCDGNGGGGYVVLG